MVQTHESVATILYNSDLNDAIVVRQFRPPVYASLLKQMSADDGKLSDRLDVSIRSGTR